MTSDQGVAMPAARARRSRLFTASVTFTRILRHGESTTGELTGRWPGCGGLIRSYASGSVLSRCGHCEAPLIACPDGSDVEQAAPQRLYRPLKQGAVEGRVEAGDA